jgi:dTDP-4-amino-4,6-dideoxy-D-galactose acyltransferase
MSYQRLDWDSAFFETPIGRLLPAHTSDAGKLALALREADDDGIACLYLQLPVDDQHGVHVALDAGFRPYDIRVELDRDLEPESPGSANGVRPATPDDITRLERIARDTFRQSRFFADERFPRDRVRDLYAAWARRGVESYPDRRTFIADPHDAFITCGLDAEAQIGTIELLAVAPTAARQNLGATLVRAADLMFIEAGLGHSVVATQGRNIAAQRLYQRAGYRTRRLLLWLHRWSPGQHSAS